MGTRSRLAAMVANFKADVGGAEGRAVWAWAGETAPTWLLWLGRDWVEGKEEEEEEEEEDGNDPQAEGPDLLRGVGEEYGGLEGPEKAEDEVESNTSKDTI